MKYLNTLNKPPIRKWFGGTNLIILKTPKLRLRLSKNHRKPKSAFLFIQYLDSIDLGGSFLDVGTGDSGILAYYANARGVKKVTACDKSASSLAKAQEVSKRAENIRWCVSDVFSGVKDGFDIIVSNAAQMPMPQEEHIADYGGVDGRDMVIKLLQGAHSHLNSGGKMLILLFDFLGVDKRLNSDKSLLEIAENFDLKGEVLAEVKKDIREGGETEKNLEYINKIYPLYKFQKNKDGEIFHKIYIVQFALKTK